PTVKILAPAADSSTGRIPFRLRVGVTGHRILNNEDVLVQRVEEALERIRAHAPSSTFTPVRIGVVSPLAEGADRLVARAAIMDDDATLEVPLPLPIDEYRQDFETEASKREFDQLLEEAGAITILPLADERNDAYEFVGEYV